MLTPGPWRSVRVASPDYYSHEIETTDVHIASVARWGALGSVCPASDANARLIEHAPDLAEALRDLLNWAAMTGDWDAPCWERARRVLDHANPSDDQNATMNEAH